eukprot:gene13027-3488_t
MANLRLPTLLVACLCLWATAQASRILDHEEPSELSTKHSSSEEAMAFGGKRSLLQVVPPTVTKVSPVVQPMHLLGGDTLMITGTLFATGATILVGNTNCTGATVVSASSMTCVAPAMPAGEYAVSVTNTNTGRSNATAVVVRYAAYMGKSPC